MRRILIVIDMQKDFVDGSLGTAEAQSIVPSVREKILSYPSEDVFYTLDTHEENYLCTQEGHFLPVTHCIRGTEGWELTSSLKDALKDAQCYEKPTFGSLRLARDLTEISHKEDISLELIGLCTDICVVSNALMLKAAMPEVPIYVDSICCAGVTPEKHLAALETMRSCQIQVL